MKTKKPRRIEDILNDIHEKYPVKMSEALRVINHLEAELEHRQMAVGMLNAVALALRILQATPADVENYFPPKGRKP